MGTALRGVTALRVLRADSDGIPSTNRMPVGQKRAQFNQTPQPGQTTKRPMSRDGAHQIQAH